MNKSLAIAVLALAFAAVNGQAVTATATTNSSAGNGTSASWCRANSDCAANFCCGASRTGGINYVQFNCVAARNFSTNTTGFQCIQPNQTYLDVCATEERVCTSTASRYTLCGGRLATSTVDLFNSDLQCSNAFTLVSSVLFAVIASLALVF